MPGDASEFAEGRLTASKGFSSVKARIKAWLCRWSCCNDRSRFESRAMTLNWSNFFRISTIDIPASTSGAAPRINLGGESEMKIWRANLKILTFTLILLSAALPAAGQKTLVPSILSDGQPDASKATPQAAAGDTDTSLHRRNLRYTVHPSDTLELNFQLTPEYNQTVTVQPDGYITLRDVGDLSAAGHTLPELTESIKAAYSKLLHDPVLTVDPKDFERPYFTVGGQVGKPGKFDWRGDVTLTQAIAIAGRFHGRVQAFASASLPARIG